MPASYPTSAKAFTTKVDGAGNTILAAHVNDLQNEVTAVETDLIAGLPVARGGTGLTAIGAADTVLTSNGSSASWAASVARLDPCGRLSLTSGTPVTSADVTAATTLYYALYKGNQIALYTGSAWVLSTIAELSIAVPSTTSQMYDVFVDYNAGTPVLAVTAWTNDTTRATSLTTQNGVLVQTGNLDWRYVGSFRTTTVSGQTEDSVANRLVWNYYNRVDRAFTKADATASWTYATTATIRQVRAQAANQITFVVGVAEVVLDVSYSCTLTTDQATLQPMKVGIGLDVTNALSGNQQGNNVVCVTGQQFTGTARMNTVPAVGYHYAAMLEAGTAAGTATYFGTATYPGSATLVGSIQG